MTILLNHAFVGQRTTGQQRYATELSRRLLERAEVDALAPPRSWAAGACGAWAWVLIVLPVRTRGNTVVSMTSRAPVWVRQHVVVVHDLFVLEHPEWYSRRYVLSHAPLLRAHLRGAALVIAVSEPVADQVRARRQGPVVVAPNAPSQVFRARRNDDDDAVRARALEPGAYLLVVGSRDPRKNLARLAAAYGTLPEDVRARHPLVVAGGGSDIFADATVSWPNGTVEAGYVTDDELRQLYRHARSVVFTSLDEGFGLPLVEAAAAGASGLLVSDIPVFRWICIDQVRYVDPTSVPAMAAALYREIEDPQHQELDLDHFTWDASAEVVADACRRLVSRGRSGHLDAVRRRGHRLRRSFRVARRGDR